MMAGKRYSAEQIIDKLRRRIIRIILECIVGTKNNSDNSDFSVKR